MQEPSAMHFGPEKRTRVIIDTDAKNEADDQFAIVHGLLTAHALVRAARPDPGAFRQREVDDQSAGQP
jgi:hypothetical protein